MFCQEVQGERVQPLGPEMARAREQFILLKLIDGKWKDHLSNMDHLRSGIGFRGYGGVDPRIAYKKEGFDLFDAMLTSLKDEVAALLLRVEAPPDEGMTMAGAPHHPSPPDLTKLLEDTWKISSYSAPASEAPKEPEAPPSALPSLPKPPLAPLRLGPAVQPVGKPSGPGMDVGRNDPCPCGSGKKYKKCHGA